MKDNKGPLDDLDNIENIEVVLDEEELRLINLVFNEVEEFNQITDTLEQALSSNIISHYQFKKIFKTIIKVVYYKISLNMPLQAKKSLVRTFFELPEIISKKIHLFIYRNTI
ncbi:hypothetical protein ACFL0D_07215 [Thermoproteota archaeon]